MQVNNCFTRFKRWGFFGLFVLISVYTTAQVNPVNKETTDSAGSAASPDSIFMNTGAGPRLKLTDVQVSTGANVVLDSVFISNFQKQPYISLQQMLKGNASGLYVQEASGEPGTEQYMYLHGLSRPLLSKQDIYGQQPVVYINGVPLMQDNNITFNVQSTEFNRIGTATNLLAGFDPNNIESIRLIKDPLELAKLGPLAANGAIWVITKDARSGLMEIDVNAYFGIATNKKITPVNAAYENAFRQPFYAKYGTVGDRVSYPTYLSDSTNNDYYGPSDWTDLYFKNTPFHAVNASLSGGTKWSNIRFFLNNAQSVSGQDGSKFNRYSAAFFINIMPMKWLTVSSMINAGRLERGRNRSVRDRLSEIRYIPDLSTPLSPNKEVYNRYLTQFDDATDENKSNSVQGYFSVAAKLADFSLNSRVMVDYNEGIRNTSFPSSLLDDNNFVSFYSGYNQRIVIHNSAAYIYDLNAKSTIGAELGQSFQTDVNKYDYGFGYNTPNDFIKIRATYFDDYGKYLTRFDQLYFPLIDKTTRVFNSFYGQVHYSYNDYLKLTALVRRDGSSTVQPDKRWTTAYGANVSWNIYKNLLAQNNTLSAMDLNASYSSVGIFSNTDMYSVGPRYVNDASWASDPNIGSYLGFATASRPYTQGWTGYGIGWEKTDKTAIGLHLGFLNERINFSLNAYNANYKDLILPVQTAKELGYAAQYDNGMTVNNKGIDLDINAVLFQRKEGFSWTTNLNFNINKNQLKALPNGLQSIVINNRLLEVGKPIDAFWVYQNEGIYNEAAAIPVSGSGVRQSFNGVPLNAGDPKWKDVNGDFNIDNKDKVLKGHALPTFTGGFFNSLAFKRMSLDFHFFFALGQKLLNQEIANRLDFINNDRSAELSNVKEITFWQKTFEPSDYPLYNPWSDVVAYRKDQDLFLQNASFVKLRSVTLGYDIIKPRDNSGGVRSAKVYVSGTNLLTLSPFKNGDPELVDYQGNYTGYPQMLPRTLILGVQLGL